MLYQVGSFQLFGCCRKGSFSMRGQSPEKALQLFCKFERAVYVNFALLMCTSISQSVLILMEIKRDVQLSTSLTIVQVSLLLQYVQVILLVCLAVSLQYLSNFMNKAAAKDDPIQLP